MGRTAKDFFDDNVNYCKEVGVTKLVFQNVILGPVGNIMALHQVVRFINENPDKYPGVTTEVATSLDLLKQVDKIAYMLPPKVAAIYTLVRQAFPDHNCPEYSLLTQVNDDVVEQCTTMIAKGVDLKEYLSNTDTEDSQSILDKIKEFDINSLKKMDSF